MKFFKIKSYAKVNLSLNVTGKFNNGLHKIESLVSFVNLFDLICIREIKKKNHNVYFEGMHAHKIKKNNTITKLLKILDEERLIEGKKFEIKIIKNIPTQSGLGGGSMNASSLISFFLRKSILRLKKSDIFRISNLVGSDVILGLNYKNTILSSNGRIKKFKKKLNYYALICKPKFGCSTGTIYSKIKSYSKSEYSFPRQSLLSLKNIKNSKNKLENIAFSLYPKLKKLKLFLLTLPDVIFVRMSGSGSSIVAYFYSKKALDIASKKFKKKFKNYWFIKSKTV